MPDELTTEMLMKCLIGLKGRAERLEPDQVVESFSSVGPLFELISIEDHQVIFGRRGTGKTHALRYLYEKQIDKGDCAIFVDMRSLGSDASIYNDSNLSIAERATRLLIDTLSFIQDGILAYCINNPNVNLAMITSPLDRLADAISQVRVVGDLKLKTTGVSSQRNGSGFEAALSTQKALSISGKSGSESTSEQSTVREVSGTEKATVRFPNLSTSLSDVINNLPARRVWIILDEWSAVPTELQPFLADMFKRTFFTIQKVSVKIGAIEHRTKFTIEQVDADVIGIELTADIRSNVRLDDYLIFENNNEASINFFKEFIFRHVKSFCKEKGFPIPDSAEEVYKKTFNQKNSFEEFVKSAEGVPRDALHIASNCAQKSLPNLIDIPKVRAAGHRYYQEDKSSQVEENEALRDLLQFIVDNAIRKKKTNAFLLENGKRDRNVDLLFDRRLVHIRQRNVSSRDNPGSRYIHYKIDYGCYVDLIATKQMPAEYDFSVEMQIESVAEAVEVPMESDARSYRRSILDLDDFYSSHPEHG